MLNKVMIIGRLGKDPELRYSPSGTPMATLSVATDEGYTDREGNRVDRTEWHRVTLFQRNAENATQYLAKGSLVFIEGSLQTRKWQDQQGQDRYTTEIRGMRVQFLDRRNTQQGGDAQQYDNQTNQAQGNSDQSNGYNGRAQGGGGSYGGGNRSGQQQGGGQGDYGGFPSEYSSLDDVPF